ncbi:hypothetical protein ACH5RR_035100 [Cinchona calisaya]|uniref:Phospholipid/glycerol acyltransferase domain-containing protein n=1 Tax=Cinchona calisaya TaxID=153742 RepID=A0ABD2YCV2_9GENT
MSWTELNVSRDFLKRNLRAYNAKETQNSESFTSIVVCTYICSPCGDVLNCSEHLLAPLVNFGGKWLAVRTRFVHNCRKAVSLLFGLWLGLWPFFFEKINKTKVIFSGDTVPDGERVLLIANHRTDVDWMYPWDLALRKGCLGSSKYVLEQFDETANFLLGISHIRVHPSGEKMGNCAKCCHLRWLS